MTVEELVRRLAPFYTEWNVDGNAMYLRAANGPRAYAVMLREIGDGTPFVEQRVPTGWVLGIDNAVFRDRSAVEFASVEVNGSGEVLSIRPYSTAHYNHVGALMRAAAVDGELRELVSP